jgi:hypothetical protein
VFHTILDSASQDRHGLDDDIRADIHTQSLRREVEGLRHREPVVSEAYAPDFALRVIETRKPRLLETDDYRATHRAVYEDGYKLIRVEDVRDQLFSLRSDPRELHGVDGPAQLERLQRLAAQLEVFLNQARQQRPGDLPRAKADLDDEIVRQRLRDLGYME